MGTPPRLSKSKYTAGLQCFKRLYFKVHNRELATPPNAMQQASFDQGHRVGALAREAFPGGTLLKEPYRDIPKALALTREYVDDPAVPAIFEGTFSYDNILIMADVLQRVDTDQWRLIEVKSSSGVKQYHLHDIAVQKYVIEGCGLQVVGASLMHLNRDYRYNGSVLKPKKLFRITAMADGLEEYEEIVPDKTAEMKDILKHDHPPEIEPGSQCKNPHRCEFFDTCNEAPPEGHISELYRAKKETVDGFLAAGIENVVDIPDDVSLSEEQTRQKKSIKESEMIVEDSWKDNIARLTDPLYMMDFETFAPAIPLFEGTGPYDSVPFQWSVHVRKDPGGECAHFEFLSDDGSDTRERFLVSLLDVLEASEGSIVTYNAGFEKEQLDKVAERYPQYIARVERIKERVWDLLVAVRASVYHPGFRGSFSLKNVLPTLVPNMKYKGMAVSKGGEAGIAYADLAWGDLPDSDRDSLRHALLDYCAQDTLGMAKIIDAVSGMA